MFMRPLAPTALLATLATSAMGCSFAASPDVSDAEASALVSALVLVERSVVTNSRSETLGSKGEATRAEAVARFVRVRGASVDDASLRVAGVAADFPPLGTCLARTPSPVLAAAGTAPKNVELVDVGPLVLESGSARTALVARQVPDTAGVLFGVVYTARSPAPSTLFPEGGSLTLRAPGTADGDIGAFVASATPPRDIVDVRLAGQDPRAFTLTTGDRASSTIELGWTSSPEGDGPLGDFVLIEVQSQDAARSLHRCSWPDTGRGALPGAALASDEGTLTVHRIRREAFHSKNLDGEIRFDFARSTPFLRR